MKQLSLMSVLRSSTLVCVLFGFYQPTEALRQPTNTSSLYGALSSGSTEEPPLNLRSIHTHIDTPATIERIDTKTPDAESSKLSITSTGEKQPITPTTFSKKAAQEPSAAQKFMQETMPTSEVAATQSLAQPTKKTQVANPPVSTPTLKNNAGIDNNAQNIPTGKSLSQPSSASSVEVLSPTVDTPIPAVSSPYDTPTTGAALPSTLMLPDTTTTSMPSHNNKEELIEFQFEGTDLDNLVKQVAILYDVIFIPDDTVTPLPQESKALKGNKVSFKTHRAMTKGQAWDIFITFLYLSGFALAPDGHPKTYRITTLKNAQHNPLPTYISIDYKDLPDSDQLIRYVYFIENATTDTIKGLLEHFKSPDALVQILNDSKAFVITDRSYNIKVLINLIKELDKASMPQELLVLKLHQVDAQHVKDLYEALVQNEDKSGYQRFFPPRKTPTSLYFPENVRIIAEKRTNTLIILGPKDALKVLEDFIVKHVDVDLDQPYSKITTHQLKYADASTIATIMNNVTQLGASTDVGKVGGVRGADKFVRLSFVAEPDTNSLLIKGDYEDYLLIKPSIEQLDQPQPQVAIEVLLLSVESGKIKQLGSQLRTREPAFGLVGDNVKFQKAGLNSSIVQNTTESQGSNRLLGDLISLVAGTSFGGAGKTVVTMGSDKYGVWGIFRALEQITDSRIISNPFITTSNKTPARVAVGEIRRVISSKIITSGVEDQNSYVDDTANLEVKITPQINSDGMISLQIEIDLSAFTTEPSNENAVKVDRKIITNAIVANKEILALGGLIQNETTDNSAKVPLLGDIPILGWLFKDKKKQVTDSTLLVLISTQIIRPTSQEEVQNLRKNRAGDISQTFQEIDKQLNTSDPVDKTFFNGRFQDPTDRFFTEYIDRKFGVKQYQDLLKEKKKIRENKKERAAKTTKKTKIDKKVTIKKSSEVAQQEVAA